MEEYWLLKKFRGLNSRLREVAIMKLKTKTRFG